MLVAKLIFNQDCKALYSPEKYFWINYYRSQELLNYYSCFEEILQMLHYQSYL